MATASFPLSKFGNDVASELRPGEHMAEVHVSEPHTSVEQYLHTSYRPDREWVDGALLERYVGELPHSRLQKFFIRVFAPFEHDSQAEALPEQRVQVSPTRYRVPDICLVSVQGGDELMIRTPPLLCIEILSREDRIVDVHEKLEDYRRMGVQSNWVIDPWRREAFSIRPNGNWDLVQEELGISGTAVHISIEDMFAALTVR